MSCIMYVTDVNYVYTDLNLDDAQTLVDLLCSDCHHTSRVYVDVDDESKVTADNICARCPHCGAVICGIIKSWVDLSDKLDPLLKNYCDYYLAQSHLAQGHSLEGLRALSQAITQYEHDHTVHTTVSPSLSPENE
ncbi:hypothetical protein EJ419_07240 [Alloscardovia theropitheci]|uniref:Uncharacterized protein n=1 Tax=Alloscardovia theropitheci TaxID=2496842 RepID=A0A4R0QNI6_9BIFI|nr:hypothetical protein [Alloscardovia theropitheci]TCD53753.1 hypothetical protein EJ419_07240 [Alloscardovia theropitheci]